MEPPVYSLDKTFRSITIKPTCDCITVPQLLQATEEGLQYVLEHCLQSKDNFKANTTIRVLMHKINISDGSIEREDYTHFSSYSMPIQSSDDINDFLDDVMIKLGAHIDNYTSKGSNWVVAAIEEIALRLVKYKVLKGGADKFELPNELLNKKCVLNIESKENECAKWAIIASLHHEEVDQHNKNRRANYEQFVNQYDFSTMKYPATVEDLTAISKS